MQYRKRHYLKTVNHLLSAFWSPCFWNWILLSFYFIFFRYFYEAVKKEKQISSFFCCSRLWPYVVCLSLFTHVSLFVCLSVCEHLWTSVCLSVFLFSLIFRFKWWSWRDLSACLLHFLTLPPVPLLLHTLSSALPLWHPFAMMKERLVAADYVVNSCTRLPSASLLPSPY